MYISKNPMPIRSAFLENLVQYENETCITDLSTLLCKIDNESGVRKSE